MFAGGFKKNTCKPRDSLKVDFCFQYHGQQLWFNYSVQSLIYPQSFVLYTLYSLGALLLKSFNSGTYLVC